MLWIWDGHHCLQARSSVIDKIHSQHAIGICSMDIILLSLSFDIVVLFIEIFDFYVSYVCVCACAHVYLFIIYSNLYWVYIGWFVHVQHLYMKKNLIHHLHWMQDIRLLYIKNFTLLLPLDIYKKMRYQNNCNVVHAYVRFLLLI